MGKSPLYGNFINARKKRGGDDLFFFGYFRFGGVITAKLQQQEVSYKQGPQYD